MVDRPVIVEPGRSKPSLGADASDSTSFYGIVVESRTWTDSTAT